MKRKTRALDRILRSVKKIKSVSAKVKLSNNPIPAPVITVHSSAADVAESFLGAQGYDTQDGLFLRWHQSEWLRFMGKIFVSIPTDQLEAKIMAFLRNTPVRSKAKRSFVGDVVLNLKSLCCMEFSETLPARWNGTDWVPQPDCIVVENGIVDLKVLFERKRMSALTPHNPSFVSQVCLPFKYKPKARCPKWLRFVRQILPDPGSQQLLKEIFGYCLTFDTSQQKFFMFEGTGGNGKGVVTNILTKLLGESNISNLPLESFGKDHDPVVMLGKLVNITSEIGPLDRVAEGQLKRFTGEDAMNFNPKFRQPFSARPTARILISTNVRPNFTDRSDGVWRRLIIMPFPVTIPEERRDPQLVGKLTAEMSGIFNWAVEGATSLRRRNQFIDPKICRAARDDFKQESNPARMFLEEMYELDSNGEVSKTALYREYKTYCDEGGYKPPLNGANFAKEVLHLSPKVTKERPRQADGSRIRVYRGIVNKEQIENQRPERAA